MIVTVVLYLIAAYSHFHASLAFSFPHGAFDLGAGAFWTGLGAALTLAIYDYSATTRSPTWATRSATPAG